MLTQSRRFVSRYLALSAALVFCSLCPIRWAYRTRFESRQNSGKNSRFIVGRACRGVCFRARLLLSFRLNERTEFAVNWWTGAAEDRKINEITSRSTRRKGLN